MFNFKRPNAVGYQEAIEQARKINGIRKELHALTQVQMLEFSDIAALEMAIEEEIAHQRRATDGLRDKLRAFA